MSEPTQDEIVDMICSRFMVADVLKGTYSIEFRVVDSDCTERFADLARTLEGSRYICRLVKQEGGRYIIVQRFPAEKRSRLMNSAWTPRILFAVVCAFVMIDGYHQTAEANNIVNLGDPLRMAVWYTIALLGILGTHEAGHLVAAKVHRLKTTWPFFIPGLPIIGIPTFGAFIRSSGLTINRKILFDVAIAGPIAGAVVAIAVAIIGAWTAPVLDEQTANVMLARDMISEFQFGESILLYGALELFGKGGPGTVWLTPILWASWIGFLITFLNLLPAWQLDGGHMARTLLGPRIHQYATYASMGVLVLLNYWVMALLILVLSIRNPSATPLDDVSPLPKNRKIAYIGVVALAVVCAPLPAWIMP